MPYLPDKNIDEQFGPFHIWNWAAHKSKYVQEAGLLTYLDRYFSMYKKPNGQIEDRLAVIESPPNRSAAASLANFPQLLGRFCGATMLAYLVQLPTDPNAGMFATSSDNFVGYFQKLDMSSPGFAFEFGSYFRARWISLGADMMFVTPQYVPDPPTAMADNQLLSALAKICDQDTEEARRIFRSLDWVRFAFGNAPDLPFSARIVAMATAFEILLDIPEEKKGQHFSEMLNALLPANHLPLQTKLIGHRKPIPVQDNAVGWWCRDFYALRSKIVHGDEINAADFGPNGMDLKISLYLFDESLRGLLVRIGILTAEERLRGLWFRQKWIDAIGLPHDAFPS